MNRDAGPLPMVCNPLIHHQNSTRWLSDIFQPLPPPSLLSVIVHLIESMNNLHKCTHAAAAKSPAVPRDSDDGPGGAVNAESEVFVPGDPVDVGECVTGVSKNEVIM